MSRKNNQVRNKMIKSHHRNADAGKLDYLQTNSNGIKWFREIPVHDDCFSTPNHTRIPDLAAKHKELWIILEHDTTKIHGELGFENERTVKRNRDYGMTNRPFFVINQELCKILCLDEAKLATYLYYHTISQYNSKN